MGFGNSESLSNEAGNFSRFEVEQLQLIKALFNFIASNFRGPPLHPGTHFMLVLDIALGQYQPASSGIIKLQKGETSPHPTFKEHSPFRLPHNEALLDLAALIDIVIVLQEQIQLMTDLLRRIEFSAQNGDIWEVVELRLGSIDAQAIPRPQRFRCVMSHCL